MDKKGLVMALVGGLVGSLVVGTLVVVGIASTQSSHEVVALRQEVEELKAGLAAFGPQDGHGHGRPNVLTTFNTDVNSPQVSAEAFVDPLASVIGDVILGHEVYVAPFASIRGDEGQPIALGDETNVQDGVVIHALETIDGGVPVPNRTFEVNGRDYAVYIGRKVSLAHQSQVHGPARIDDNVFIGMQALVFKSAVGAGAVVEPGAKLIGVSVAAGHYVPAGSVITDQAVADKLPLITPDYPFRTLNDAVVHVNSSFAKGYAAQAESVLVARSKEGAGEAEPAKVEKVAVAEKKKPEAKGEH